MRQEKFLLIGIVCYCVAIAAIVWFLYEFMQVACICK